MKHLIALLCVAFVLTGCGKSDEEIAQEKANDSAQDIVREVQASWNSLMPFEAGSKNYGVVNMDKAFVIRCAEQLSVDAEKLKQLKTKYSRTDVSMSEQAIFLQDGVNRWATKCNEIKRQQGW